jgi:hypothetical protein
MTMDPRSAFERLLKRVDALRLRQVAISAAAFLLEAGAIALGTLALLVAIEIVLAPSRPMRTALTITLGLAGLALLATRALRFERSLPTRARIARRFEGARPEVGDGAVVGALSLWPKRADERHGYSHALIDAHLAETAERATGPARGALEGRALRAAAVAFAAILAFAAAGRLLAPRATGAALARLAEESTRRPADVRVTPGDVRVVAGTDVVVRAEIDPPPGRAVAIASRAANPQTAFDEAGVPNEPFPRVEGNVAAFERRFDDVQWSFEYQVRVEDWRSPVYRVTVERAPLLLSVEKRYRFPAYSGLAERVVEEGDGHLKALKGTEVLLTVKSGGPMSKGALVMASGAETPLAVEGGDARSGTARLTIREPNRYHIALSDAEDNPAEITPTFDIQPVPDEAPIVTLLSPASDTTLARDMVLPVRVALLDDYGLSKAALVYSQGEGEKRVPLTLQRGRGAEAEVAFDWDISGLNIMPGQVLTFYAEAWDNDAVSGPKRGVSRTISARFPTLAEIYDGVRDEEAGQAESLEEAFDQSMSLKERVEQMTRDLRRERDESVSWQRKEEVEKILEKQEEVAEELGRVAEELDRTMNTLERNELANSDVIQKLAEIRRLVEEVATDEMKAAMERLRKALEQLDPKEIAEASKNLNMSQEEFLKRLDRTIEMLKAVQRERRVDEMVKTMEALLEKQESLLDATKEASKEQMKGLAPEQEALRQETEKAIEKMDALAKEIAEKEAAAADAMKQTAESLRGERTEQTMSDAAKSLSSAEKSSASSSERKAASDLAMAVQGLQSAQNQMNARRDDALRKVLEKGIRDVIYLSKAEEGVVEHAESDAPVARGGVSDLARRQSELERGIHKVADEVEQATKHSLTIGPTVPQILRDAGKCANESAKNLSEGQTRMGGLLGDRAMVTLNAGLLKLLEAQKNFESSCQNGQKQAGQCQNPGLGKISEGQRQVNEGASGMCELPGGQRLSMSDHERLSQLAAQQQAIRKGLEEFAESVQGTQGVLGRLDKIGEEMKEAEQELRDARPEDAAKRGERILQRLLDADKSFQKRGFKRERTSETARTGEGAPSPASLSEILEKVDPNVREDVLRTMSVRFPEEYEALIRAYFEAIERDGAGGR